MHLQVSCHFMCLVSLFLDIKLNTLTFKSSYSLRNSDFCIWIINVITVTTTFIYLNTKRIKHGIITITISDF